MSWLWYCICSLAAYAPCFTIVLWSNDSLYFELMFNIVENNENSCFCIRPTNKSPGAWQSPVQTHILSQVSTVFVCILIAVYLLSVSRNSIRAPSTLLLCCHNSEFQYLLLVKHMYPKPMIERFCFNKIMFDTFVLSLHYVLLFKFSYVIFQ